MNDKDLAEAFALTQHWRVVAIKALCDEVFPEIFGENLGWGLGKLGLGDFTGVRAAPRPFYSKDLLNLGIPKDGGPAAFDVLLATRLQEATQAQEKATQAVATLSALRTAVEANGGWVKTVTDVRNALIKELRDNPNLL